MAFEKGRSGNPGGRKSDKPFAEALRMEIAAAGPDHKALREIARNLLFLAMQPSKDAMPAISAIADRLDGKPDQKIEAETTVQYVARIPNKAADTKSWQQQHSPTQKTIQ